MSSILDIGVAVPSDILGESLPPGQDTAVNQAVQAETTNSVSEQIQQALGYHPNPLGQSVSNAASQIGDFFSNLFRFGNVSNPVDTSVQTPRISTSFNPNIAIGSAAAVGTTALVYSTLTNPGVQQTAQSYAGAVQNISKAFQVSAQTAQSVLTSQYGPVLLIGGLALAAVLLLKK